MSSNLPANLTVDEMARAVDLRHSRLNALFKAEFGMSPVQYHKLLKLEKACELLQRTSWTVDRCRLEVGYEHSHFFKDFKAHFGLTPRQYRAHQATVSLRV